MSSAISARIWFDSRPRHSAFQSPELRIFLSRSHSVVALESEGNSAFTVHEVYPGTELSKKLWGEQTLLFVFLWRQYVHSTVVRSFCKIDKMGGTLWNWWPFPPLATPVVVGTATSSVYKYTMVLYLAGACAEFFPRGGKVDILLILFRYTKRKCPMLRQQLQTVSSL